MKANYEKTVYLLDCLQEITGCPVIWKATDFLMVEHSLPVRHNTHENAFCNCIKDIDSAHLDMCKQNDFIKISRRALELRAPFVNNCHAGVAELVVPIFNGNHYLGAILCGPFRNDHSKCINSCSRKEYEKLPVVSEFRVTAMIEVITRVVKDAGYIMESAINKENTLPGPDNVDDPRIKAALSFVARNFCSSITINDVAKSASLSQSRFQHIFKENTRMSFHEYLQRLRIGEARRLLLGTGLSMSEIATTCGIADQSRFAVLFKRYYKTTPTAYCKYFNSPYAVLPYEYPADSIK